MTSMEIWIETLTPDRIESLVYASFFWGALFGYFLGWLSFRSPREDESPT